MDRMGGLGEAVVFLDHFQDLPDPRQAGKVSDALDEVLLLSLLAVPAGAEGQSERPARGCRGIRHGADR